MERPTIAQLIKACKGVNYPANKSEILAQAKENKASKDIIRALKMLTEADYQSANEISRAFALENRDAFWL
ncbi:MAG: DUF2795 domain-containing protein [Euryarchaeota archaeon]|nr:DUF2795 domain-containing protein [Euryarchaeota archaeon]MBV1729892.1 DUF2795 domain-containing protein [Methanobacterium sp.]MBV1754135.1 DUF2795 domain-containing protein [Methanobacterium sp.]MBV1767634.1 DUF2795 domain-containing protein [Methanobacterium sp.]